MPLHEKAGAPKPPAGEGVQKTPVRGLDRSAALADRVIVVAVRHPEVGDAANVDLLHEARLPHALEDAVGGDEAEPVRPPPRALPDVLARGEMTAGGEGFEDGDALGRDPQAGAAEKGAETIA